MSNGKGKRYLDFYGVKPFFMVTKELMQSVAFRVLTPQEKMLLMEWLRHYGKHSYGSSVNLPAGMMFTWSACEVDMHEDTFGRARQRLLDVGFLKLDPMIQSGKPGSPYFFKPSTDWRKYQPSKKEIKRLGELDAKKKNRIAKKNRRRTDFRADLGKESK